MFTHEQKLALLSDMIAFALIDGELHPREKDFLLLIASEMNLSYKEVEMLFENPSPTKIIKSEFERYLQFYRLALIMFADKRVHPLEFEAIQQIALNMGLNLDVVQRILMLMFENPDDIIDPKLLFSLIKEQHN